MVDVAPLPHEWMIISIIGFFVSWLQVFPYWSEKWGMAFMVFFIVMFLATVVSMTHATVDEEHLIELAIHEKRKRAIERK